MTAPSSALNKQIPLDIVGSTKFGAFPKISVEQTFNMYISDGWLIPTSGYEGIKDVIPGGEGRGIYASNRFNHLVFVINNKVFIANSGLIITNVGEMTTYSGDVFISENNGTQIALCDKQHLYIYDWMAGTFQQIALDFQPVHITFQDGYFISPAVNSNQWRLSDPNDGTNWPPAPANVGELQTKPDYVVATSRAPGKGNLLFVFGKTVTELWYDTGSNLFPYQKNSYSNIDYGCLNASTIAENEDMTVWLAGNEKSGPAIMYSLGGDVQRLSTDGIDVKLAALKNPSRSAGFLYRRNGHVFYQLTFFDPRDNFTFVFDFTGQAFYTLTDQRMNYHIARRTAFFNNVNYFVAINNGVLYKLEGNTYDGDEIPRVRVCKNVRLPDQSRFVVNSLSFTVQQGETHTLSRIDLRVSRDGGVSFGNYSGKDMNAFARHQNILQWWNLGAANDFVPQFRFFGDGPFVAYNGVTSVYQ